MDKVRMTFPIWQLLISPTTLFTYLALIGVLVYQVLSLNFATVLFFGVTSHWLYKNYGWSGKKKQLPPKQTRAMNVCIIGSMYKGAAGNPSLL